MTGELIDKTFEGHQRAIRRELDSLDRRIGRLPDRLLPGGGDLVSTFRGTTAQRDALYGVPATDSDRVILANAKITWFNTDLGWEESYYAVTGTSGLIVRGLMSGGPTAGWYPVGDGPRIHLQGTSSGEDHVSGQEFDAWQPYPSANVATAGMGFTFNFGGTDWWDWPTVQSWIGIKVWGFYDIYDNMSFPNGSGTGVFAQTIYRPSDGTTPWDFQKPVPLLGSYGQQVEFTARNVALRPGDRPHMRTVGGAWHVGGAYTFHDIRYRGPLLAP